MTLYITADIMKVISERRDAKKNMDDKDVLILQLLNKDPGMSLHELRQALQCSIGTAHARVQHLTDKELIEKTPKGVPRRRSLTPSGIAYLEQRHLIWHDPRGDRNGERT